MGSKKRLRRSRRTDGACAQARRVGSRARPNCCRARYGRPPGSDRGPASGKGYSGSLRQDHRGQECDQAGSRAKATTQSYATGDFLKVYERPRIGGIRATVCSQRRHRYSRQVVSAHFSLAPKSRFPETETARRRDSVRMPVTPKQVRASGAAETTRQPTMPVIGYISAGSPGSTERYFDFVLCLVLSLLSAASLASRSPFSRAVFARTAWPAASYSDISFVSSVARSSFCVRLNWASASVRFFEWLAMVSSSKRLPRLGVAFSSGTGRRTSPIPL